AMVTPALTVRELRTRWQPHKERLDGLRDSHPTSIRFHRACSWLAEAERLESEREVDQILIHQWIAFNALYGQWDVNLHEPVSNRTSWQVFLSRMLELDTAGQIISLLQENRRLVLTILGNSNLNRYFWHEPDAENAGKVRHARHRAEGWYAEDRWTTILDQVVERVYLLRCQLVHGAATLGSRLNRTALKHCTILMRLLLPAVLLVWIDRGAEEDWGLLCYPPLTRPGY
ncbi:MAG: HEPN domain-containing protein, partial [Planctomycetota bacterium]|nr:HEPN domain-containing protein [Planctomycetota bacterium]